MKNNLIKTLLLVVTLTGVLTSCGNKEENSSNSSETSSSSSSSSQKVIEHITFGRYPQTKVTEETLIASLNEAAGELPSSSDAQSWTSYGYYSEGKISSYMYYIDLDLDNDDQMDYRGVYMTSYRPHTTELASSAENSVQDDNGYLINTVYWFKYEPISWEIISKENSKALVVSDLIIDAQEYNYRTDTHKGDKDYKGETTEEFIRANNYMFSHVRSFLNTTFYQDAFSVTEQAKILLTTVDNSASSTHTSASTNIFPNTEDKIFLLSYTEVLNYGIELKSGSDYSKSQGLVVSNKNDSSSYILRSPTSFQDQNYGVSNYGVTYNNYINSTKAGICPACYISL